MKKYRYYIMELINRSSYIINNLMIGKLRENKYSSEVKRFYINLYDIFKSIKYREVFNKEDSKEIEKNFDIKLSSGKFMNEEIRRYIKNKRNVRVRYKLRILNREIEIEFFLKIKF